MAIIKLIPGIGLLIKNLDGYRAALKKTTTL